LLIAEFGKDKNIRKEVDKKLKKFHSKENKKKLLLLKGTNYRKRKRKRKRKRRSKKKQLKTEIPESLKHTSILSGT